MTLSISLKAMLVKYKLAHRADQEMPHFVACPTGKQTEPAFGLKGAPSGKTASEAIRGQVVIFQHV